MTDSVAAEGRPKSPLWLAFRVFDEPARVFQELATRPRALVPVISLVVVMALAAFATPTEVLREQTREAMEAFRQGGQLTDGQVQQRVDAAGKISGRLTVFGMGTAVSLAGLAVVSLVLMLIFGATSSESLRFKSEFGIVAHANMVALAGAVFMLALVSFAGFEQLQLSMGFLFDQESSPFLYRFGSQITAFGAWSVFLLALGNKIKTKATGLGGPLVIVGGLWLLVKAGFALLGGVFGGLGGA